MSQKTKQINLHFNTIHNHYYLCKINIISNLSIRQLLQLKQKKLNVISKSITDTLYRCTEAKQQHCKYKYSQFRLLLFVSQLKNQSPSRLVNVLYILKLYQLNSLKDGNGSLINPLVYMMLQSQQLSIQVQYCLIYLYFVKFQNKYIC